MFTHRKCLSGCSGYSFQAFFFYSSALELGVISPFLGGGVGLFNALTFSILFPVVVFTSRHLRGKSLAYFILFFGLLLYALFYLVFHYFFGTSVHQKPDVIMQWLILILSWGAIFSIGYFWPKQLSNLGISVLVVMLCIMSALVILNPHPDPSTLLTSLGRYQSITEDWSSDDFLSYQGYGRSMSVTGLVVIAIVRRQFMFWVMSGIYLTALFLIGSRSDLLGVLLVFPILVIYQFVESPKITVLILTVTIATLSVFVFTHYDDLSVKRQKELFNLSESASFQARMVNNKKALEAIKKNPIVGDFSGHAYNETYQCYWWETKHVGYFDGHAYIRSGLGHYAHNLLSSWRQLGLIGFLLYSTLMVWPVIGTFHVLVKNPDLLQVDIWRVTGVISIFMLLLALGAKSIFSPVLALSWGIFIAAIKQKESIENY